MGKGDKKSRKGKISKGSFGNSRPKKVQNKAAKAAKLAPAKASA
ncbi:30S ribosomal protein THX [Sabulibacter ruber]|nr:30S ribosomal protein THX [Sabulibacter ruber]